MSPEPELTRPTRTSIALIGPNDARRKVVAKALASSEGRDVQEFTAYPPRLSDVARMLEHSFDLVMIDLDSDEQYALEIVKKIALIGSPAVMVYSTRNDPGLQAITTRAGACDFLPIPADAVEEAQPAAPPATEKPESGRAMGPAAANGHSKGEMRAQAATEMRAVNGHSASEMRGQGMSRAANSRFADETPVVERHRVAEPRLVEGQVASFMPAIEKPNKSESRSGERPDAVEKRVYKGATYIKGTDGQWHLQVTDVLHPGTLPSEFGQWDDGKARKAQTEVIKTPEATALQALTQEPAARIRPEPAVESKPEPVTKAKPEPVAASKPEPLAKAGPEQVAASGFEPFAKAKPEPVAASKAEPLARPNGEPVAKIKPEPTAKEKAEPLAVQAEPATAARAFGGIETDAELLAMFRANPAAVEDDRQVPKADWKKWALIAAAPLAVVIVLLLVLMRPSRQDAPADHPAQTVVPQPPASPAAVAPSTTAPGTVAPGTTAPTSTVSGTAAPIAKPSPMVPAADTVAPPPHQVSSQMMDAQLTAPSRISGAIETHQQTEAPPASLAPVAIGGMGSGPVFGSAKSVTVVPALSAISAGVAAGMLIHRTEPVYPTFARESSMSGTVVLKAKISKAGTIEDLHVVSGPKIFIASALDAVKTWRYRPYKLNNQPVEVETTINVVFSLGQH
jgi:periplasmic protein TonB